MRRGRLTSREREVLQLLAEGRANKEIASALGITTKTAETHRARIMAKLEVHSIAELVRYAIRNASSNPKERPAQPASPVVVIAAGFHGRLPRSRMSAMPLPD